MRRSVSITSCGLHRWIRQGQGRAGLGPPCQHHHTIKTTSPTYLHVCTKAPPSTNDLLQNRTISPAAAFSPAPFKHKGSPAGSSCISSLPGSPVFSHLGSPQGAGHIPDTAWEVVAPGGIRRAVGLLGTFQPLLER